MILTHTLFLQSRKTGELFSLIGLSIKDLEFESYTKYPDEIIVKPEQVKSMNIKELNIIHTDAYKALQRRLLK